MRSPATAGVWSAARPAHTFLIVAHDYAYTGLPQRIPAGWTTFRLFNAGREMHMFSVARVPPGHTSAEVLDSLARGGAPPESRDWGGPNVVSPGDTATITMYYPVGHYVAGCAVVSADGKLHLRKGMLAAFDVTASDDTSTAPARAPDVLVKLSNYHVDIAGLPLKPGTRTVRVRNAATQGHDLQILQLRPGHSVEEALAWFELPPRGPAPARAVGGVSSIHPGQVAFVTATFAPGTYSFICWVPDASGHPHYRRGMRQTVTVRASN